MRSPDGVARVKFDRHDFFPPGWETSIDQFLQLFHRYGYIYKPLDGGTWLSANQKWELSDSEILKSIACVHPRLFIGCRAGKSSSFAALDIDANSKYHSKSQLDRILSALSQAGLKRSSLYRSSYSGGWHLYIFFDEPIHSADLRRHLIKLLTLNDFEINKGTLEVFPHRGDASLGVGLRLPLQPGWAWLDKKTLEVECERSELSPVKALELFVDAMDGDANSYADFRRLIKYVEELERRKAAAASHAVPEAGGNVVPLRRTPTPSDSGDFSDFVKAVFGSLPPGIITDNWYRGRLYYLNGLSGPSQRSQAIICLGHYFFYGDPSRDLPPRGYGYEDERAWTIQEFLKVRHNEQSEDINRGRPDAIAEAERAAHWMPAHRTADEPQKYSPTVPVVWIKANAKRQTDARRRISAALNGLKKSGGQFTTVELQKASGCSRRTLYDHLDIWRKDYEDLASGFFAFCTGEYTDAVGAASCESKPPSAVSSEITPPGLLAARRIVYELSMRSERDKRTARKVALWSQESLEKRWRDSVDSLTRNRFSELPAEKLKSILVALTGLLSIAPSYEEANQLLAFIAELRQEISSRFHGPQLVADAQPGFIDPSNLMVDTC